MEDPRKNFYLQSFGTTVSDLKDSVTRILGFGWEWRKAARNRVVPAVEEALVQEGKTELKRKRSKQDNLGMRF